MEFMIFARDNSVVYMQESGNLIRTVPGAYTVLGRIQSTGFVVEALPITGGPYFRTLYVDFENPIYLENRPEPFFKMGAATNFWPTNPPASAVKGLHLPSAAERPNIYSAWMQFEQVKAQQEAYQQFALQQQHAFEYQCYILETLERERALLRAQRAVNDVNRKLNAAYRQIDTLSARLSSSVNSTASNSPRQVLASPLMGKETDDASSTSTPSRVPTSLGSPLDPRQFSSINTSLKVMIAPRATYAPAVQPVHSPLVGTGMGLTNPQAVAPVIEKSPLMPLFDASRKPSEKTAFSPPGAPMQMSSSIGNISEQLKDLQLAAQTQTVEPRAPRKSLAVPATIVKKSAIDKDWYRQALMAYTPQSLNTLYKSFEGLTKDRLVDDFVAFIKEEAIRIEVCADLVLRNKIPLAIRLAFAAKLATFTANEFATLDKPQNLFKLAAENRAFKTHVDQIKPMILSAPQTASKPAKAKPIKLELDANSYNAAVAVDPSYKKELPGMLLQLQEINNLQRTFDFLMNIDLELQNCADLLMQKQFSLQTKRLLTIRMTHEVSEPNFHLFVKLSKNRAFTTILNDLCIQFESLNSLLVEYDQRLVSLAEDKLFGLLANSDVLVAQLEPYNSVIDFVKTQQGQTALMVGIRNKLSNDVLNHLFANSSVSLIHVDEEGNSLLLYVCRYLPENSSLIGKLGTAIVAKINEHMHDPNFDKNYVNYMVQNPSTGETCFHALIESSESESMVLKALDTIFVNDLNYVFWVKLCALLAYEGQFAIDAAKAKNWHTLAYVITHMMKDYISDVLCQNSMQKSIKQELSLVDLKRYKATGATNEFDFSPYNTLERVLARDVIQGFKSIWMAVILDNIAPDMLEEERAIELIEFYMNLGFSLDVKVRDNQVGNLMHQLAHLCTRPTLLRHVLEIVELKFGSTHIQGKLAEKNQQGFTPLQVAELQAQKNLTFLELVKTYKPASNLGKNKPSLT